MQFQKIKTALIGSGMISGTYLENLKKLDVIDLAGCSDIIPERSKQRAERFEIRDMTNEEILSDPSIELVINTTYPMAHYEVAKQCLEAGKSVYTEKMICRSVEEATELINLAKEKNLFFGGAPDTFFSASMQAARNIIDSGIIGTPVMVQISLGRSYHHERHFTGTEKRFAFCPHGGILFDMGSYYLTAAVFLLGAIQSVTGFTATRDPHRVYQNPNGPLYGTEMLIETNNITAGTLLFESGVMGTLAITSETVSDNCFCIYCTDGVINLGDPNEYESIVRISNKHAEESVIHSTFSIRDGNFRGYGAAEAMYARMAGRKPRCDGDLTRHVLEAALGICESGKTGRTYQMTSTAGRPEPFRPGYTEYPELVLK